jgi:hypothetical protein
MLASLVDNIAKAAPWVKCYLHGLNVTWIRKSTRATSKCKFSSHCFRGWKSLLKLRRGGEYMYRKSFKILKKRNMDEIQTNFRYIISTGVKSFCKNLNGIPWLELIT